MNVMEEYQIPEYQFQETFIGDFIRQTTGNHGFNELSLNESIDSLSKYSFNFDSSDLAPADFKKESSKIFKFDKIDNNLCIVLDMDGISDLKKTGHFSRIGNTEIKFFGLKTSIKLITNNQNCIKNHTKTEDDLVNELNSENKNNANFLKNLTLSTDESVSSFFNDLKEKLDASEEKVEKSLTVG